jgi:glycosyltransferase involved in cell wall biosynthesis
MIIQPLFSSSHHPVSVIITTKNEELNIVDCLESIKAQKYPSEEMEIIVVDNNSTDKTKGIAYRYTDKVYNFGPERSAQRNFGAKQAGGKYILYLDADVILSENVISECVKKCEQEGCIALYIPERIVNLSSNNLRNQNLNLCNQSFWIKVRDFERSFYNATYIDAVRFVRKDKFLEIDGFDENLTGPEDWDFDRRIGAIGKAGIINASIYHNEGNFDFNKYLSKKIYYSCSFSRYVNKWGLGDLIIKKQLGFAYRCFGVFVEHGKWRKLIKHPFLALGMYYLRITVGFNYFFAAKES